MPAHMSSLVRLSCLAAAVALCSGCLDALYEDLPPAQEEPDASWAVCCDRERVTTCACGEKASCEFSFLACAGGSCRDSTVWSRCGGGADAGIFADGGIASDGGVTDDAGTTDGGEGMDGGTPDAGKPDAGGEIRYVACCDVQKSRVTTCGCVGTVCEVAPFTSCPGGTCVAGTGEPCP